jgi:hypothetical protein
MKETKKWSWTGQNNIPAFGDSEEKDKKSSATTV